MFDPENLVAFQRGDEKAFQQLYHLLNKRLKFFAAGIVSEEVAGDIVQDAFVKLWERREHFANFNALKGFLYLAVKNACFNLGKHDQVVQRYQQTLSEPVDEQHMLYRLIEAEVIDEVYVALQRLPEGCRNVIFLSYFEGLTNQEVADELHVSINTVKTQKVRALKLLRIIFSELSPGVALLITKVFFYK
jgi:RNA polymerase sigma-70 factor (family 1)